MADRAPLIRPAFARWSIISFVLLLPFVVYSAWDYVETRRLRTRIDAIAARGEPTTTGVFQPLQGPAAEAARYYTAASALVFGYSAEIPPPVWFQVSNAVRSGSWTPDLVDTVRALVTRQSEALTLLDHASALPFEGFQQGTTSNFLVGNLMGAQRLCQLRGEILALDGQADAALDSIYTGVQLNRVTNSPLEMPALAFVLQRTRPSQVVRAKLSRALAELDREDLMQQDFIRSRALMLDAAQFREFRMAPWFALPWGAHRLSRRLDIFSALVTAAGRPPAERVNAVMAVGEWPSAIDLPADRNRATLEGITKRFTTAAERIRCARRLVAEEMVNCSP
jgi:hypothetical protein